VFGTVQTPLPRAAIILLVAFVFIINFSIRADAYIDPGSGSYLFQLAVSGAFALMFVMKSLVVRLVGFLRRPARGDKR